MPKRDQDAVLFLAVGCRVQQPASRREFVFLNTPLKRVCFEALLGISSHRTDRIGAIDLRYGKHDRPPPLMASIDSLAMVLYNSVAEPLPDRFLGFKAFLLRLCAFLALMNLCVKNIPYEKAGPL